jgi:hypothetical protein
MWFGYYDKSVSSADVKVESRRPSFKCAVSVPYKPRFLTPVSYFTPLAGSIVTSNRSRIFCPGYLLYYSPTKCHVAQKKTIIQFPFASAKRANHGLFHRAIGIFGTYLFVKDEHIISLDESISLVCGRKKYCRFIRGCQGRIIVSLLLHTTEVEPR